MVLSHSLEAHDLVFLLFPTFYRQLALAEMPRTRDLAIFVMTTATMMTEPITLPLCACVQGNKPTSNAENQISHQQTLVLQIYVMPYLITVT